ncbi:hypothetical protein [Leptospira harrisiae]|uniref:hypothetical protein n=1 Tax=Leptospira harrisiae TaxID=2023189 RepID=UPI000C29B419|nr:hypothetical protein [Leptospira harrisiae]PKA06398.1 hypothetical protein CH366_19350 [Leptospira harrisiae]
MNDFEKARLLYQMLQNPDATESAIENIKNSISDELRNRIERIMESFKHEDIFKYIYSALPWTHLIHSLDETQYPESSKQKFQVPDSILIYKSTSKKFLPLLIDVKTVLKEKETLKNIQINQTELITEYSKTLNSPIIYAIYWEKIQTWTLNSLDQFERKASQYKIPIAKSFVNDLSSLVGDVTYIFPKGYRRKSIIDPNLRNSKDHIQHEKYGAILEEYISFNQSDYIKLEDGESSIIDSTTTMREISNISNGTFIEIIEEAEHELALKLSTLILRVLSIYGQDINANNTMIASKLIQNFFGRVSALYVPMIPRDRTAYSDKLYFRSFYPGSIYKNYKLYNKINIFNCISLYLDKDNFG